ncbi:MAG: helix-turn-helix transcriptional regulator [Gemmatimonadota bacterium]|nr:MAG: helix-turn-helix transcriptional regulator [Candidatus Coatesbacteria bacterium]UCG85380.1 MAG: helix-turn-helix transcriptional regulator [Gemmatimonadota bacterium]
MTNHEREAEVSKRDYLGDFEQVVLLAVMRLGPDAYGVSIKHEIEQRAHRKVTLGAIYPTLDRLEAKGLVSSRVGKPTAERGGRAKRHFEISAAGRKALRRSREMLAALWDGFEQEATP